MLHPGASKVSRTAWPSLSRCSVSGVRASNSSACRPSQYSSASLTRSVQNPVGVNVALSHKPMLAKSARMPERTEAAMAGARVSSE